MSISYYHHLAVGRSCPDNESRLYIIDLADSTHTNLIITCLTDRYCNNSRYKMYHRVVMAEGSKQVRFVLINGMTK